MVQRLLVFLLGILQSGEVFCAMCCKYVVLVPQQGALQCMYLLLHHVTRLLLQPLAPPPPGGDGDDGSGGGLALDCSLSLRLSLLQAVFCID